MKDRYYCSCPFFLKKHFPKTREWLENVFGKACHKHDMAYGKYFTTFIGGWKVVHADVGDRTITRFDIDTWFFNQMVKLHWKYIPFAVVVRLYFLIFGGIVWERNKIFYKK